MITSVLELLTNIRFVFHPNEINLLDNHIVHQFAYLHFLFQVMVCFIPSFRSIILLFSIYFCYHLFCTLVALGFFLHCPSSECNLKIIVKSLLARAGLLCQGSIECVHLHVYGNTIQDL